MPVVMPVAEIRLRLLGSSREITPAQQPVTASVATRELDCWWIWSRPSGTHLHKQRCGASRHDEALVADSNVDRHARRRVETRDLDHPVRDSIAREPTLCSSSADLAARMSASANGKGGDGSATQSNDLQQAWPLDDEAVVTEAG
ncbi:MAG: hypothetical protein JJ863_09865 [Deltaproteobacteria bacterium]|nr:hypothetical protein [Deltaproteobacteria bacterium]